MVAAEAALTRAEVDDLSVEVHVLTFGQVDQVAPVHGRLAVGLERVTPGFHIRRLVLLGVVIRRLSVSAGIRSFTIFRISGFRAF